LWVARLKDMSIPSFVDHKKGDEERFYVKAGPFGDAATAQEMGEKIRIATGVAPKLIELP
jgi:hypothetical protein